MNNFVRRQQCKRRRPMFQECEDLIKEYGNLSHKDNAISIMAEKYGKSEKVMWQFLVSVRRFLDNSG